MSLFYSISFISGALLAFARSDYILCSNLDRLSYLFQGSYRREGSKIARLWIRGGRHVFNPDLKPTECPLDRYLMNISFQPGISYYFNEGFIETYTSDT